MAEYIEREAALNRLCQENCGHDYVKDKCKNCYTAAFIEYMPAADVAPVVHAKWENVRGESSGMNWKCSKCFKRVMPKSPYCPNCGAHMKDGE